MKKLSILLTAVASLVLCSTSNASITNVYAWSANTNNIYCTWDASTLTNLDISGNQYNAGLIKANIYTDSPEDPTLTINNSLDNDSTFTWTAYHVNVYLSTNFTLSAQAVTTPGDWSAVITQQGNVWNGSAFVGQLDFYSGTPIPVSGALDFTYKMTFFGLTQFSFTQELIPVPEPSTLGLVLIGGMLLARFTVGRGRQRG
jgi:hypothetical protein